MEELGYVGVKTDEGGRKSHDITESGRLFLAANKTALDGLRARMGEATRMRGESLDPRITLGMENVKRALRLRLSNGPLTADQIADVAAALDTAATAITLV